MNCKKALKAVEGNEISPELKEHVAQCPDCRLFYNEYLATSSLIRKRLALLATKEKTTECPNDNALAEYVDGLLVSSDVARVEMHIANCDYCLSRFYFMKGEIKANGANVYKKLSSGDFMKRILKTYLPLIGMFVAFVSSFVFPRHFVQCLIVAGILGFYVVLERSNALLLGKIYRLWRAGKDEEASQKITELKHKIIKKKRTEKEKDMTIQ